MKRAERQRRTATLDELPDLSSALQECTENLNRIIDVVQAHGSRVVMMTQPRRWRDDFSPAEDRLIWLGSGGELKSFYSPRVLAEAMSLYNETLLQVCESRGIHCIDLAARVPRSLEMFYDDARFAELGAHFVARTLGAHLTASPRDRALPEQIDGQSLEQRGELRAGLRPRDPELLDPVRPALHPRHRGLDPGRELHRVQMPPPARLAVIPPCRRPALRTRVRPRPGLHPHHHALPPHVYVHARHRPRGRQPQERSVQLHVAHRSDPPRSEHSWPVPLRTRFPEEPSFLCAGGGTSPLARVPDGGGGREIAPERLNARGCPRGVTVVQIAEARDRSTRRSTVTVTPRLLREGVIGGLIGATMVAVWFLIYDAARGAPFRTPTLLGSAALQGVQNPQAVPVSTGLVVQYTVLHGVVWLAQPVLDDVAWWAILLANVLAAGGMLAYFFVGHRALGRALLGPRSRVAKEGLVAGGLGAAAVAVWFLLYDTAAGAPLRTPALLGAAVLEGLRDPAALTISLPLILKYTLVHGAAFVVFGWLAAGLLALGDREPRLLYAFVMLFVCFEVFCFAMIAVLAQWLLEALAWWTIVAANLLAALAMLGYLLRKHRVAWRAFLST